MQSVKLKVKSGEDPNQNFYGQQKITGPIKKEVDSSFGNFHGNLMNAGEDDKPSQMSYGNKEERMAAMKRRMAKAY